MKQKYVLIKPNYDGTKVQFFAEVVGTNETMKTTMFLSEAHVFEHPPETMQYILDRMWGFEEFSAVPMADVDIFKAKLAGV